MKIKDKIILTIISMLLSFNSYAERITTSSDTTATDLDSSTGVTLGDNFTIQNDENLTLNAATDDNATLYYEVKNDRTLTVDGSLTIYGNSNEQSDYYGVAFYKGYRQNLIVDGTLTLYGDMLQSSNPSSLATLTIAEGATLSVYGDATIAGTIDITGTLYVSDSLVLLRGSTTADYQTDPQTSLTLYDGASITGTNLITIGEYASSDVDHSYRQSVSITVIDNDVLNEMTIALTRGDSHVDRHTTVLMDFEGAKGLVYAGSFELSEASILSIDLFNSVADDAFCVYIEGFTFESEKTADSQIIFENFDAELLQIENDGTLIFTCDSDTVYLDITKDGQTYSIIVSATEYSGSVSDLAYDLNSTFVTAVPEPSTYAMIFGALALGFAYYRRRK